MRGLRLLRCCLLSGPWVPRLSSEGLVLRQVGLRRCLTQRRLLRAPSLHIWNALERLLPGIIDDMIVGEVIFVTDWYDRMAQGNPRRTRARSCDGTGWSAELTMYVCT